MTTPDQKDLRQRQLLPRPRPTPEQVLRAQVRAVAALGTDARETLTALISRCGGGTTGLRAVRDVLDALELEAL